MIGWPMRRKGKTPVEVRLDALGAAIDVKPQALLATATQAIAEVVRQELARGRQRGEPVVPATPARSRAQARSLLRPEATMERAAELRQALGMRAVPAAQARTETSE